MSPPLPHLLPTSPPAWLPGFRARTSPVGNQAHPPSVLAFVLGRGRGTDLGPSRQLGSQVRAASSPEGQRSRESPDALASGFLGHLPAVARLRDSPGCGHVPLACGPPGMGGALPLSVPFRSWPRPSAHRAQPVFGLVSGSLPTCPCCGQRQPRGIRALCIRKQRRNLAGRVCLLRGPVPPAPAGCGALGAWQGGLDPLGAKAPSGFGSWAFGFCFLSLKD